MNQQQNPAYQQYMVQFMSYLHGVHYDQTTTFPIEDLATITPDDVKRWMCLKCFGVEHPRLEDLPTLCRSSTLEVYKKALSWYMPNRVACWDEIRKNGNPTRSKEINELIKHVKKKEVRLQGKAPCTKRALTQDELCQILFFSI
jgi:hypothetical protein